MDSKLTLKGQKEKWYPAPINQLEKYLEVLIVPIPDFQRDMTYPLIKNLSYALQYVEFLNQIIKDVNLSEVLEKQNVKSFVIHSASIVEALFQYVVVSSGHGAETEWKSINKFASNQYTINSDSFKNETEIFIKLPSPICIEMTFDKLVKKVESKKLLGSASSLYKDISHIRKLRNRVHLHGVESVFDTDYNNFDASTFGLMRRVLYGVLTSTPFDKAKNKSIFDYLL